MKTDINLPRALMKLPVEDDLTQDVKDELAKFVCLRTVQRVFTLPVFLIYYGICSANKLPRALDALEEHIKRVQLQSGMVPSHCHATTVF